jgi:hypothetical protein
MTLIRDLIDLPERVHSGDFVLRLTEGVSRPKETIRDYVVTPQLQSSFDDALDFIKSALDAGSSKASYLHGSFGSGKSHFMAVLHLLLQNHPEARSIPDLASVVAKHNAWTEGKRFLLIPYHMIGAASLESAILSGYVEAVRKLHPDAPIPGVYKAESLFDDARDLRKKMGDAAFFEGLNRHAGGASGGWGDLEASWDKDSFEAALRGAPGSEDRSRLIGSLVQEYFRSYQEVARGSQEAFVPIDDGLAIVSQHARALGYSALVLFLDELILWLATHWTDAEFLNREGSKLSKLVESSTAERPIPIVSFVARQRDLRDLVGEHVTGAEQLRFADVLSWWEARFHRITLEDRNLPEIAAKRVLRPKSEAARIEIDQAFRETEKVREEVMSVLLTPHYDRSIFRKVYPFSPALVEALIAVSSLLQRERTALKVMLQLLVDQRDTLSLGEVVPVGDLFDVIAEGDEPFIEGMRIQFENAKRLYFQKLLPMLEKSAESDPGILRTGGRLLKTLLLAALVPEVEALKGMTVARLTALNHGTVRSPIPGRENQKVLQLLRDWAAQVGELKLGDDPTNPTVSLQLSAVDTETILANADKEDNLGNRRRKIRDILFQELGIENQDELFVQHEVEWHGTKRDFDVVYGNVRELTDESLSSHGDDRKVIVDFPFDPEHTPDEDLARLEDFRRAGHRARTLVWLPSFLSRSSQKDLGTLVKLDHILTGERLKDYASHLSAVDRAQARELLRNQQSQLRQRLTQYLEGAYDVRNVPEGWLDTSHGLDSHFHFLDPGFEPARPVGANLAEAFAHLLAQVLDSQYPAHPRFGVEVKLSNLRKVQAEIARAIQDPQGRIQVEKPLRPLMKQVAEPLKLGEMGETHFVIGRHWLQHFEKSLARSQGAVTVGKLRAFLDEPVRMGLTPECQNLVLLAFADQTNRSFYLHGGAFAPALERLPDELELREQTLPEAPDWESAVARTASVFGEVVSELRNASNVSRLIESVRLRAGESREAARSLSKKLEERLRQFGVEPESASRLSTARSGLRLVETLAGASEMDSVRKFASADLATSEAAVASSLKRARSVSAALEGPMWVVFEGVSQLKDERETAARGILAELRDALSADEYAVALEPKLAALHAESVRLLAPPPVEKEAAVVDSGSRSGVRFGEAHDLLRSLEEKVSDKEKARLDLRWTLYEE